MADALLCVALEHPRQMIAPYIVDLGFNLLDPWHNASCQFA
jgi:hypothetical protein